MSNPGQTKILDKIFSDLLVDDPDMLDLVEEFINGLDTRVDDFRQAFEQLNWDNLTRLAHQLKGAGGSYGYVDLSTLGKTMEDAFRAHSADSFAEWMTRLEQLLTAARAGLRE